MDRSSLSASGTTGSALGGIDRVSIEHWCSMSKCRHAIALLICGIVAFGSAQADSISGRVVAVADGDTVTLQDAEYHLHRIRVAGIDAPEKKQDFGDLSKLSLAALVFNQDVVVVGDKMDRYGRRVGKIMVADPGCAFPPCADRPASAMRAARRAARRRFAWL